VARAVPTEVVAAFARIPLFEGLSKRSLRNVVAAATEIDHSAGKVIVREGAHDRFMYVIVDGTARVDQGGRRLRTMGPGDFFGEFAFLTGGPRTATVTAETHVRLLILSPREMDALIHGEPTIAITMLTTLARRLRATDPSPTC
jgi:CRP-like cAMP-binding protein